MSSTRNEPEGEEDEVNKENSDDEFGYEICLNQHNDLILTSTPSKMSSVADELRQNGLTPKRLGELLTLNDDKFTQTSVEKATKEMQCSIKSENETLQENIVKELEERLHYALKDTERIGELVTINDNLADDVSNLNAIVTEKSALIQKISEEAKISRDLNNQYVSTLAKLESKMAENKKNVLVLESEKEIAYGIIENLEVEIKEIKIEKNELSKSALQLEESMCKEQLLTKSIEKFKHTEDTLRNKIEELEANFIQAEEKIKLEATNISNLEISLDQSKSEFESLSRDVQKLETENNELHFEKDVKSKIIEQMSEKIKIYENGLKNYEEKCSQMEKQRDIFQVQLETESTDKSETEKKFHAELINKKSELEAALINNGNLNKDCEELKMNIAVSQKELDVTVNEKIEIQKILEGRNFQILESKKLHFAESEKEIEILEVKLKEQNDSIESFEIKVGC